MPFSKWLLGDFLWQRKLILKQTPIPDFRAEDGTPLFDGINDPNKLADSDGKAQLMRFTRSGLSSDFSLIFRHTTLYTALLPTLVEFSNFHIIAVIRNPVDIMRSWLQNPSVQITPENPQSLSYLWPKMHNISTSNANKLDKMAQIIELFFHCYYELQDDIHILKYEDVLADPTVVGTIYGHEGLPANASMLTPPPQANLSGSTDDIREALRKYSVFTRKFYPDI